MRARKGRMRRELVAIMEDGSEESVGSYGGAPLEVREMGDENPYHRHQYEGGAVVRAYEHEHEGAVEPHKHSREFLERGRRDGTTVFRWKVKGAIEWS